MSIMFYGKTNQSDHVFNIHLKEVFPFVCVSFVCVFPLCVCFLVFVFSCSTYGLEKKLSSCSTQKLLSIHLLSWNQLPRISFPFAKLDRIFNSASNTKVTKFRQEFVRTKSVGTERMHHNCWKFPTRRKKLVQLRIWSQLFETTVGLIHVALA